MSEDAFPQLLLGPLLPSDVFVANSQLLAKTVAKIRTRMVENGDKLIEALLVAPANEKYQGSQLVPANDEDYNMIRDVYKAIGQGDFLQ